MVVLDGVTVTQTRMSWLLCSLGLGTTLTFCKTPATYSTASIENKSRFRQQTRNNLGRLRLPRLTFPQLPPNPSLVSSSPSPHTKSLKTGLLITWYISLGLKPPPGLAGVARARARRDMYSE
jgi:hypothetical protein